MNENSVLIGISVLWKDWKVASPEPNYPIL